MKMQMRSIELKIIDDNEIIIIQQKYDDTESVTISHAQIDQLIDWLVVLRDEIAIREDVDEAAK